MPLRVRDRTPRKQDTHTRARTLVAWPGFVGDRWRRGVRVFGGERVQGGRVGEKKKGLGVGRTSAAKKKKSCAGGDPPPYPPTAAGAASTNATLAVGRLESARAVTLADITTAWVDQWNVPAATATFPSCPNQPTIYNPNAASIPYVVTAPGQWGVGGRCIPPKLAASGDWCPSAQPGWSRFREHAYGTGTLDILSPTKAVWSSFSQEGAMLKPVDQIVITRSDSAKCAQTQATIDAAATVGVSMADVLAASKTFNATAAKAKLVDVLTHGGGAGGAALDPKGAASGVVRGAGDYVAAKLGRSNFTLNAVLAQLANKTG